MDNRPSWMTANDSAKRLSFKGDDATLNDNQRKKNRLWVCSANIFVSNIKNIAPPMPLDVDNGLPGIELWFGNNAKDEICFICHMDTCAAMNAGNLTVHKWLMTFHPHLVAKYIQSNDANPFEPLRLHCAVEDLAKTESMNGKFC